MTAKKLYKHFLLTNVFSIRDKIKEQRKKNKHGNKNSKTKN